MLDLKISSGELTLNQLKDEIEEHACYSFDIEHQMGKKDEVMFAKTGFELWGISFAVGNKAWWIPDEKLGRTLTEYVFSLDKTSDGREVEKVGHNLKYDLKCLKAAKWITKYPDHIRDTMVGMNLLDDNRQPNKLGLDVLAWDFYQYKMLQIKDAVVGGKYSALFRKYATDDVVYTLKIWLEQIKPKLLADQRLWNLYTKILMPVCRPFADMELTGIQWDFKEARRLLTGFAAIRDSLEDEILSELGPLNLQSGDQLAKRLFEELGYSTKGIQMTPGGEKKAPRFSVDEEAMAVLAETYPICKKIVYYRTANKMISTYVEANTRKALEDPLGKVHPTIWIVSTTGRTRMSNPNFQNQPVFLDDIFKGLKIRACVIPTPGKVLLACDFSQIELRIASHVTQDPVFLQAYRDWTCTKCNNKGTSESLLLHSCPKCGCPENEDILKVCPSCKRLHVKFDKKTGNCSVCRGEQTYEGAIIRGFWHGLDLHQMTADAVPTLKGNRSFGKVANFALIYCATGYRMHMEHPELSVDEWDAIVEQYMARYQGVRAWHIRMEQALKRHGVCTDLFGRKRRITKQDIAIKFKHALNMFVNFPIQSTAAALMMLSLSNIYEKFMALGVWGTKVLFSNSIHDENVFEVDPDFVDEAKAVIADKMENCVQFRVPIRVDIKQVNNWSLAK